MNNIDLHIHSNYSDGSDSIDILLAKIIDAGIKLFALSDHDTIKGCKEMATKCPKDIQFIPTVELTCLAGDIKCHILGYGCDPDNIALNNLIEQGKLLRRKKLETRIEYLKHVWGIELTKDELDWLYSRRSVVKTHIANILYKRGLGDDNVSIMKKYLDGCKTGNTRFDGKEAVSVIQKAGGIPVWAHPLGGEGEKHISQEDFIPKLNKMISYGIKGLECYYSRYNLSEAIFLQECAKKNNLFVTAGSDYHGTNKKGISLGQLCVQDLYVSPENISILDALL